MASTSYQRLQQQPVALTQEQIDKRLLSVIDPYSLCTAHDFADMDREFQTAESLVDNLIFDMAGVPPAIQWGLPEDIESSDKRKSTKHIYEPKTLNSTPWWHILRPFLGRARVIARRVGFVAYAYLNAEKMSLWWKQWLKASTPEKARMPPPFLVIEASSALFLLCRTGSDDLEGSGARVPLSRLEVEWCPEQSSQESQAQSVRGPRTSSVPPGMCVSVYIDKKFNTQYPPRGQLLAYQKEAARRASNAPIFEYARQRLGLGLGGVGGFGYGDSPSLIMPVSPIFELMRLKARIAEAIHNQQQAEGCLVQPHILLQAQNLRLDPRALERQSPEALGMGDNATQIMIEDLRQQQMYSYEQWEMTHAMIQEGLRPPGFRGTENTPMPSQISRLLYNRPHPHENPWRISENTQVAHVHKPETLVDIAALEQDYRQGVAECVGIGTGIWDQIMGSTGRNARNGSATGSKGGSGAGGLFASLMGVSHETPAERHLQHVIQVERHWMSQFFDHVYANSMYALDLEEVEMIHNELHQEIINMKEAKAASKIVKEELKKEMEYKRGIKAELMTLVQQVPIEKKKGGGEEEPSTATEETISASPKEDETSLKTKKKVAKKKIEALEEEYRLIKSKAGNKKKRGLKRMQKEAWLVLWNQLVSRPDTLARLVFHPGTAEQSARKLSVLLEGFYPTGLVSPETMEPFMKDVFGEDVKLEKNPVPPLEAAKALSPGEELAAETTLETAELQAETTKETTSLQGEQKENQIALQAKVKPPPAKAKPKAKATKKKEKPKPKPKKKKKKSTPKSDSSSESEDDSSEDDDESSSSSSSSSTKASKKRKRGGGDDKGKRPAKRARGSKD